MGEGMLEIGQNIQDTSINNISAIHSSNIFLFLSILKVSFGDYPLVLPTNVGLIRN